MLSTEKNHPAKYAPGLATVLHKLAGTDSIGDPFAGTGRLAEETRVRDAALNEIDVKWESRLRTIAQDVGCEVSIGDARYLPWSREVLVFSPPYYPRTDRCKLAASKEDPCGFRTGYGGLHIKGFIGDPTGTNAILHYRDAMREVYAALRSRGNKMIVVVKNTIRLGVELRLDLDTILTAQEVGWSILERHGWTPPLSMWQRFNHRRGTAVTIEDVLVFV